MLEESKRITHGDSNCLPLAGTFWGGIFAFCVALISYANNPLILKGKQITKDSTDSPTPLDQEIIVFAKPKIVSSCQMSPAAISTPPGDLLLKNSSGAMEADMCAHMHDTMRMISF